MDIIYNPQLCAIPCKYRTMLVPSYPLTIPVIRLFKSLYFFFWGGGPSPATRRAIWSSLRFCSNLNAFMHLKMVGREHWRTDWNLRCQPSILLLVLRSSLTALSYMFQISMANIGSCRAPDADWRPIQVRSKYSTSGWILSSKSELVIRCLKAENTSVIGTNAKQAKL